MGDFDSDDDGQVESNFENGNTEESVRQSSDDDSATPPTLNQLYTRSQSVDLLYQSPKHSSPVQQKARRNLHIRQASTPAGIILEPLVEKTEGCQDFHRRHSIACEPVFTGDSPVFADKEPI